MFFIMLDCPWDSGLFAQTEHCEESSFWFFPNNRHKRPPGRICQVSIPVGTGGERMDTAERSWEGVFESG